MMMHPNLNVLVATLLSLTAGVGCAHAPAANGPSAIPVAGSPAPEAQTASDEVRITLRVGAVTVRDALVEGTELTGLLHGVTHFDDGYRGRSPQGFVYLSEPTPGTLTGVVIPDFGGIQSGSLMSSVEYEQRDSGHVHASGRWALRTFGLEADRNQITIRRRLCTDVYRRVPGSPDAFAGTSNCFRNNFGAVVLRVPNAFFDRSAGEQVVFLSSFLL
jgi:hypothetical protein